ncbi:tetratricopeptide repeat protein [Microcoleus sp. B4-D4]|uniref:tetratricopeptide repeat protein n=1 Tax=Microcoleus sp. B4-D4 TaxID=2818667 RepID=UPI002FCF2547
MALSSLGKHKPWDSPWDSQGFLNTFLESFMENNVRRNLNWKKGKEHGKILIEALYSFTDADLERSNPYESLKKNIDSRWQGTNLWVKQTRLRDLVYLTQKCGKALENEQIRNALHCLKALDILEDRRNVTSSKTITGSDKWSFLLKFPSLIKADNLDWLFGKEDQQGEWEKRRFPEKNIAEFSQVQDVVPPQSWDIIANNRGLELKEVGELVAARKEFDTSLKLNPDNPATYYNKGWMNEEAGKVALAIELYQEAAVRGFAAAYCNLARLYIIEYKDLPKAVQTIGYGLKLVKKEKVEHDKIVEAALFTYLAWAWKEQGRFEEALEKLQESVKLDSDRGLSYGIMAEVQEHLGNGAEALEAWKNCLEYGNFAERDEDFYIGKARQRLK